MLTPDGCQQRLARLLERIRGEADALVIHRPEHLLYLANFFPRPNSLNLSSTSFLYVDKAGESTLYIDNWLADAIRETDEGAVEHVEADDWYDCVGPAKPRSAVTAQRVIDRIARDRVETLAAEVHSVPASIGRTVKQVRDVDADLREFRQVKDGDELRAIGRGIRTAETMHAASREFLRPGMTELEYYSQLVQRATLTAGAPFVMMCDIASGDRAAKGGGAPTERVMQNGELVILDLFPYVEGYRGDITNSLVVGGAPSAEQNDLFAAVRSGLEAAESTLGPGRPVRDVYEAVDAAFEAAMPGRKLVHHAGHAIGLGHPEAPEIVPRSDAELRAGMVITLEPGLYDAPTGGIRVEHDYLITADGYERLSGHELGLA